MKIKLHLHPFEYDTEIGIMGEKEIVKWRYFPNHSGSHSEKSFRQDLKQTQLVYNPKVVDIYNNICANQGTLYKFIYMPQYLSFKNMPLNHEMCFIFRKKSIWNIIVIAWNLSDVNYLF